jgi:hypothetical protein
MMTPTHGFVGAAIGAGVAAGRPAVGAAAIIVGFVAGALPDVDLLATHRRTCHFPVLAPALAVPVTALALVVGSPVALLGAIAALAVAAHCLMDVFGGGVEHHPWEATSERAVYDHVADRWVRPRRWVRWSGAPEDLALALACGIPVLAVATGGTRAVLGLVLAMSVGFVLVRRRLAGLSRRLFDGAVEG